MKWVVRCYMVGALLQIASWAPCQAYRAETQEGVGSAQEFRLHIDPLARTISLKEQGAAAPRWTVKWPQEGRPMHFWISDDGSRVVLVNYFGERRHGDDGGNKLALVFLGAEGQILAGYKTNDLMSSGELPPPLVGYRQNPLPVDPRYAYIAFDGTFRLLAETVDENSEQALIPMAFRLRDGTAIDVPAEMGEAIFEHLRRAPRQALEQGKELWPEAIRELALLDDVQSVPRFKALLDHPSESVSHEAAKALVSLTGKQAVPLLQAKLTSEKLPADQFFWFEMLVALDVAPPTAIALSHVNSEKPSMKSVGLHGLILASPTDAAVIARKWVGHQDRYMRDAAFKALVSLGSYEDVPLFIRLLDHPDHYWIGWSGLLKANPPKLNEVLTWLAGDPNHDLQLDAMFELAKRGDRKQLAATLRWIDNHGQNPEILKEGPGNAMYMKAACEALLAQVPKGAVEALNGVLTLPDLWHDSDLHIRGALVLLGEREHLNYLRHVAKGLEPADSPALEERRGDVFRRMDAIEWIGRARDDGFVDELRQMATGRDAMIRKAAREALAMMTVSPRVFGGRAT